LHSLFIYFCAYYDSKENQFKIQNSEFKIAGIGHHCTAAGIVVRFRPDRLPQAPEAFSQVRLLPLVL
jgi:hypothetical protein